MASARGAVLAHGAESIPSVPLKRSFEENHHADYVVFRKYTQGVCPFFFRGCKERRSPASSFEISGGCHIAA
jgi:hypothetical protein